MRNCIYCFFLIILFSACNKDEPLTGENHLVKITYTGTGGNSFKKEYGYDASGRLVKHTYSPNGNTPVTQNLLNYTGNELAISYNNLPSGFQKDTWYQLDAQNRPAKRIYSNLESYMNPNGSEKHFGSETTDYEYNVSGYLIRYTGVSKDSISYYPTPGVLINTTDLISYTAICEMDGGNLKSVKRTSQQNYVQTQQPGSTFTFQQTIEETTIFSYEKNYPNHFDFKNAFLFQELEIFPFRLYFLNQNLLNYPNKAVTTKITKNGAGVVVSTTVDTEEPNLTFDTDGYFLTNIFNPTSKVIFNYGRF